MQPHGAVISLKEDEEFFPPSKNNDPALALTSARPPPSLFSNFFFFLFFLKEVNSELNVRSAHHYQIRATAGYNSEPSLGF